MYASADYKLIGLVMALTFDLRLLTLKNFSAVSTHVMNIHAKVSLRPLQ